MPNPLLVEHRAATADAIKEHHDNTGKWVGFKASGGIRTVEDAVEYMNLAKEKCGEDDCMCQFKASAACMKDTFKDVVDRMKKLF